MIVLSRSESETNTSRKEKYHVTQSQTVMQMNGFTKQKQIQTDKLMVAKGNRRQAAVRSLGSKYTHYHI